MNTVSPTRRPSAARRIGLVVLSVLSLAAALRLAVSVQGPLQILLASLGFAAYVLLFGRALEGLSLHNRKIHG